MYLQGKTKGVFALAFLAKKLGFHTEICEFRKQRILKIGLFRRVKDFFKSNQTRYGVYHVYLNYKTKKFFAIHCLVKKFAFHTEICYYFEYLFSKCSIFHRVKDLSNSNQTRSGVSHVYLECNAKRIFAIAFLGKKLAFHTEICDYFEYLFSKYSIFHRVKELSKSNQTRYGVSHVYLDYRTKRILL